MKKTINLLNAYLSDLMVLNVKFHNLHWNVVGRSFVPTHEFLEVLYNDLFLKYDEIAEHIKMLGVYPEASLHRYLELTNVDERKNRDVGTDESLKIVLDEFEALKARLIDIRNLADSEGDFVTVALLEEHIIGYNKHIWFIQSTLKELQ
jgi:starvation-inducible DNA-binding protein